MLKSENFHVFRLFHVSAVRGGSDRKMIGWTVEQFKDFLYSNPDRRAAAPYTDNKAWSVSAFENLKGQFKRILQKRFSADKNFFHIKTSSVGLI